MSIEENGKINIIRISDDFDKIRSFDLLELIVFAARAREATVAKVVTPLHDPREIVVSARNHSIQHNAKADEGEQMPAAPIALIEAKGSKIEEASRPLKAYVLSKRQ